MKTMCFAKHGWKLVVMLSPTPGRGRSHFGVVLLTDTTHNAATIRKGHSNQLIRWDLIKAEIGKFSGYMAEMTRSNPSGLSDSDKSVVAAANFAAIEKHNFESKWMELKRSMDKTKNNAVGDATPHDSSNTVDLDPDEASPTNSTGKRPMGRDATKAAKKKTSSASFEYASKMHELSVQKISLFKEAEVERKVRLDEIVNLEKVKVEEAQEHRRTMVEIERERLAMDKQRLQLEAESKEKQEDERILAINLDQCLPYQRMYYQALQQAIIEKLNARHRGRSD